MLSQGTSCERPPATSADCSICDGAVTSPPSARGSLRDRGSNDDHTGAAATRRQRGNPALRRSARAVPVPAGASIGRRRGCPMRFAPSESRPEVRPDVSLREVVLARRMTPADDAEPAAGACGSGSRGSKGQWPLAGSEQASASSRFFSPGKAGVLSRCFSLLLMSVGSWFQRAGGCQDGFKADQRQLRCIGVQSFASGGGGVGEELVLGL